MNSTEFEYTEKPAKIIISEFDTIRIRGNMNHIVYFLEVKCDFLYSYRIEKKLIHFSYDTQLNQCSCFHDEALVYFEYNRFYENVLGKLNEHCNKFIGEIQ